jgi:glycosyltransferase involved in cell wall biosynthesis
MKILFLIYAPQQSFAAFSSSGMTKCPWVDALLEELLKSENASIGLAVPVNEYNFQKARIKNVNLYGLPNPEERNILKKAYKRLTMASDSLKVNSFLNEVIDDFDPDVIQIFGSENPFGLIIEQQKKPVVIHIQGYLEVWKGKWYSGISRWEQFRYASLKDLLLMRGSFIDFFAFRKRANIETSILKNCRYFMGRTDFDRRIASLIAPASKYSHCEEFIRKDFFEYQWNVPVSNEIKCVSILKGTSYKGIDLLVKVSLILKMYSKFSFTFKICGVSENEEIITLLKKKYKKSFKSLNIEFLGKLNADNLVNQLCTSNFYVHPSYIENSPNSVCEAMALGMPVIATNVGGLGTLIGDNIEGILVQEGEPYSMAGAILELTNNYEKAKQLGLNARLRASTRHKPDAILNNILSIYDEIICDDGRKEIS